MPRAIEVPELEEEYIGDGLYASYDGFYIRLRRILDREHEVLLDPATYIMFNRFVIKLQETYSYPHIK